MNLVAEVDTNDLETTLKLIETHWNQTDNDARVEPTNTYANLIAIP